MKETKLPSGALLKIGDTPFAVSKNLYQAILEAAKELRIDFSTDRIALYKNIFCIGFSSPKIEACLWDCFKHCIYNSGSGDFKIDQSTFEPLKAREDYVHVCIEVAKENTGPFVKSLYAAYKEALSEMEKHVSPA